MSHSEVTLKRTLSLGSMVFYGLGTIVGAGIYVLIGKIVGLAGAWAPFSFIVAAFIASFTGLSYAELVGRYPRSAGEAVYVDEAFSQPWLTQCVGWAVVLTGLVSGATLLKGFSGYYLSFLGGNSTVVMTIVMLLLCYVACIGVKQSVGVAVVITLAELLGLLLVVIASSDALLIEVNWERWFDALERPEWLGITAAAFLAFYAFIGFEDMVNMAEEVNEASLTLPKAIIIAIVVSTTVYFIVAIVATVATPVDELVKSSAPMVTMVEQSHWFPVPLLSLISLIAILNGAIVQLLMAPRVIYGITKQSRRLHFLAFIHPKTQTPITATIVVSVAVLLFALVLPLARLAQLTSAVILVLFMLINAALIVLKKREAYNGFVVPTWVPVLGVLTSALLFLSQFIVSY